MKTLEETSIKPAPDFERLRKILLRDNTADCVPFYELFVNPEIMEAILGKPVDRIEAVEFYYKAGYDYVPVWPNDNIQRGDLKDRSIGYAIKDFETFDKFPWPDPKDVSFSDIDAVASMLPDGMQMIGQTGGVFETAEQLLGYEQLCYLLIDNPELVEAVFARIGELYEATYTGMAQIEKVGALVISDDMGFKTQTLLSVKYLKKYVLPLHKKLAKIAHDHGKPCILHSCGQLTEIMEDIIEDVGVDAKHSYEDTILPVTEAKRIYGDRIAILGGFDIDRLCRSDEQSVREYTRMLVTELGSKGGYALGSGNSIAKFVPVENYLTMLDEGWKLREAAR